MVEIRILTKVCFGRCMAVCALNALEYDPFSFFGDLFYLGKTGIHSHSMGG